MIRHAEAEGNLYRIVQGQHNSFITPRGHRQIACLAERFKDVQLDALYSSDLRRTVTTAGDNEVSRIGNAAHRASEGDKPRRV